MGQMYLSETSRVGYSLVHFVNLLFERQVGLVSVVKLHLYFCWHTRQSLNVAHARINDVVENQKECRHWDS